MQRPDIMHSLSNLTLYSNIFYNDLFYIQIQLYNVTHIIFGAIINLFLKSLQIKLYGALHLMKI